MRYNPGARSETAELGVSTSNTSSPPRLRTRIETLPCVSRSWVVESSRLRMLNSLPGPMRTTAVQVAARRARRSVFCDRQSWAGIMTASSIRRGAGRNDTAPPMKLSRAMRSGGSASGMLDGRENRLPRPADDCKLRQPITHPPQKLLAHFPMRLSRRVSTLRVKKAFKFPAAAQAVQAFLSFPDDALDITVAQNDTPPG